MVDESERAGKPKFRITIDLSWPHPGMIEGVTSVNDASDRSEWPQARMVRVRDIAEAAGIMVSSGVPVKMWCMDAVAFYRRYGRRSHQIGRQMMVTSSGKWLLDKRPQFGGAAVADKLGIRAANLNAHHILRRIQEFDELHPPTDEKLTRWLTLRRCAAMACDAAKLGAQARADDAQMRADGEAACAEARAAGAEPAAGGGESMVSNKPWSGARGARGARGTRGTRGADGGAGPE